MKLRHFDRSGDMKGDFDRLLTVKVWSACTVFLLGVPTVDLVWSAFGAHRDLGGPTGFFVLPTLVAVAGWTSIFRRR